MSDGKHESQTTIRICRMVQSEDRFLSGSVVKIFSKTAEKARCHRPVTRAEWTDMLDGFMSFGERDVLTHAGRLRIDVPQKLGTERFEEFDAGRRATEVLAADAMDIAQLEEMETAAMGGRRGEDD